MPYFGVHVSIAGGIDRAPSRGRALGCDAMQIFCRNQRTWKSAPPGDKAIHRFKDECRRLRIWAVSVHGSYLINAGSPDKKLLKKSRESLREEVRRTSILSIPYYTIHPGSHRGSGELQCLKRIAETLDWVLEREPAPGVTILLETTAGQGTAIGYRFEHLRDILSFTNYPSRIGTCFDTCHVFAAGYDIRSKSSLRRVFSEFDLIVGISQLRLFHLNDSQKELASRTDRHSHIGKGKIGKSGFAALLADRRFRQHAMILETPGSGNQDRRNLALLRNLSKR
jgi:deoxyribonuclease-4